MDEEKALRKVFNQDILWKNKHEIDWCNLCNVFIISCPECKGTTCNCHSCEKCSENFDDFNKAKTRIHDYLTEEEIEVYEKCMQLKKLIEESLARGEYELDFKKLNEMGNLSQNNEKQFERFLK